MDEKGPANTIYPVVLKVPGEKMALRGRDKVRFLSEYARQALAQSAQRLGVLLPALVKTEDGAPVPAGGVHWSLSHKRAFVAAVAAPMPVGIDIEKIKPVREQMHEKIAAEEEWRLFAGDRLTDFFRCWTAKEAVLKAAGVGMAGLSDCRILSARERGRICVDFRGARWTVRFRPFNGHLAAVAVNRATVFWTFPEPKNVRSSS